jgi:magnesium transporter
MDDRETWIDLLDPDASTLERVLPPGVHPTALERLNAVPRHDDEPRPRLETHGNHVFGVLIVPVLDARSPEILYQEIDVIVTMDRVISVRKTPSGGEAFSLDDVRAGALRSGASPGMSLYLLMDEVAERYLSIVDGFDDGIDDLEDNVETRRAAQLRAGISRLRHDILHVRRVLAPTRDAARSVLDDRIELDGGQELFPREVEIHFADAYDKLLRATDGLDLSRDLLAGVRDYHQAQVSKDQNEVMKRLTVVASLLLLPTFIVGLYGQNLKGAPELSFRYGYAWSWFLIVATTIAQLVYFRRKKWI